MGGDPWPWPGIPGMGPLTPYRLPPPMLILDPESGTYFDAAGAVLIDPAALTPADLEILEEGTDSDRRALAAAHGRPVLP